jgi:hypothetical protein
MVMLVLISGSLVTKTNRLSSPMMLSKCSYVPNLAKKNWSMVMPEKKDCGD